MKKKFRQITVDGQSYLWRFSPGYVATEDLANPWQCHDVFTAYFAQNKTSPLHVHFVTWEDPIVGGPLRTGLPVELSQLRSGAVGVNLHHPKEAARIIRLALQDGWTPEKRTAPFVIEQGIAFLFGDSSS